MRFSYPNFQVIAELPAEHQPQYTVRPLCDVLEWENETFVAASRLDLGQFSADYATCSPTHFNEIYVVDGDLTLPYCRKYFFSAPVSYATDGWDGNFNPSWIGWSPDEAADPQPFPVLGARIDWDNREGYAMYRVVGRELVPDVGIPRSVMALTVMTSTADYLWAAGIERDPVQGWGLCVYRMGVEKQWTRQAFWPIPNRQNTFKRPWWWGQLITRGIVSGMQYWAGSLYLSTGVAMFRVRGNTWERLTSWPYADDRDYGTITSDMGLGIFVEATFPIGMYKWRSSLVAEIAGWWKPEHFDRELEIGQRQYHAFGWGDVNSYDMYYIPGFQFDVDWGSGRQEIFLNRPRGASFNSKWHCWHFENHDVGNRQHVLFGHLDSGRQYPWPQFTELRRWQVNRIPHAVALWEGRLWNFGVRWDNVMLAAFHSDAYLYGLHRTAYGDVAGTQTGTAFTDMFTGTNYIENVPVEYPGMMRVLRPQEPVGKFHALSQDIGTVEFPEDPEAFMNAAGDEQIIGGGIIWDGNTGTYIARGFINRTFGVDRPNMYVLRANQNLQVAFVQYEWALDPNRNKPETGVVEYEWGMRDSNAPAGTQAEFEWADGSGAHQPEVAGAEYEFSDGSGDNKPVVGIADYEWSLRARNVPEATQADYEFSDGSGVGQPTVSEASVEWALREGFDPEVFSVELEFSDGSGENKPTLDEVAFEWSWTGDGPAEGDDILWILLDAGSGRHIEELALILNPIPISQWSLCRAFVRVDKETVDKEDWTSYDPIVIGPRIRLLQAGQVVRIAVFKPSDIPKSTVACVLAPPQEDDDA